MIAKLSPLALSFDPSEYVSPCSPRNKIKRKPQFTRVNPNLNLDKKLKYKSNEFVGFYSPKHQTTLQSNSDQTQFAKLDTLRPKVLKNQRSLTHLRKTDHSIICPDHNQNQRNKENSVSNSSEKSINSRRISRLQLQLKALKYENTRLKTDNKILLDENQALKTDGNSFSQSTNQRTPQIFGARSSQEITNSDRINNKLLTTIKQLEYQLKLSRDKLFQSESLLQSSKQSLSSYIKSLQDINTSQRQELFKLQNANRYMQIELRTLKKQKNINQGNKKLKDEMIQVENDNKRLRKMVIDLQTRLKNMMIFELTPDVSESQSFLLD